LDFSSSLLRKRTKVRPATLAFPAVATASSPSQKDFEKYFFRSILQQKPPQNRTTIVQAL
jgi:hypothetical protein